MLIWKKYLDLLIFMQHFNKFDISCIVTLIFPNRNRHRTTISVNCSSIRTSEPNIPPTFPGGGLGVGVGTCRDCDKPAKRLKKPKIAISVYFRILTSQFDIRYIANHSHSMAFA